MVEDPIEASWAGDLMEVYDIAGGKKIGRVNVGKGFAKAGTTLEAPMERIQLKKPVAPPA